MTFTFPLSKLTPTEFFDKNPGSFLLTVFDPEYGSLVNVLFKFTFLKQELFRVIIKSNS